MEKFLKIVLFDNQSSKNSVKDYKQNIDVNKMYADSKQDSEFLLSLWKKRNLNMYEYVNMNM